jgi:hypothetical protein
MLFEGSRKKLWLNSIKAVTKLSPALEDEILGYVPLRLFKLAKIARRVNRNDTKAQAIFKLSLKLLVEDPLKIDDITVTKIEDIIGFIKDLIQEHVQTIADKIINILTPRIPNECSLIESSAHKTIFELLLSDITDDEVCSRLIQNIKEKPSKFIAGYNDWLDTTAKNIFNAVHNKLGEGIPKGCSMNISTCTKEIYNILNIKGLINNIFEINEEEVHSRLIQNIKEKPSKFIAGYNDWLDTTANNLFDAVHNKLEEEVHSRLIQNIKEKPSKFIAENFDEVPNKLKENAVHNKLEEVYIHSLWSMNPYTQFDRFIFEMNRSQTFIELKEIINKNPDLYFWEDKFNINFINESPSKSDVLKLSFEDAKKILKMVNASILAKKLNGLEKISLKSSNQYSSGGDQAMLSSPSPNFDIFKR